MCQTPKNETEHTEKPIIRVSYWSEDLSEIANSLSLCLREASRGCSIDVGSELEPPLPNTLGGFELVIELVIIPATARLLVNALLAGLSLFAKRYVPEGGNSFIVRLLFPRKKGEKNLKKKDFPLGKGITDTLVDGLRKAIEKELTEIL